MREKPYIIGLTGGIASGKTAAGCVFERLGAKIIDADVIARKVVKKGSRGYAALKEKFASAFDGNELDRGRLRSEVFGSEDKRRILNEITHPLIIKEVRAQISALSPRDTAVLIAPLLFEVGLDLLTDINVTVSANVSTRLERLIKRDGVSADTAMAMIESQLSDSERESRSDIVIRNDGSVKSLRERAMTVYNEILERENLQGDDN